MLLNQVHNLRLHTNPVDSLTAAGFLLPLSRCAAQDATHSAALQTALDEPDPPLWAQQLPP